MPAEEAVSVEKNFEMAMPVMAKMGKATKVHGEYSVQFRISRHHKSVRLRRSNPPAADPLRNRLPSRLAIFGMSSFQISSSESLT